MNGMYIASQVIVVLSNVFFIISALCKNKLKLLFFLITSNIFFATHFFLLPEGLTGAAVIVVDIAYLITIYFLEKFKKEKFSFVAVIISVALTILFGVLTYENAFSVIPVVGSCVHLIAACFKNVIVVKAGNLVGVSCNATYMFLISSYVGGAFSCVLALSTIVGIIISAIKHKKDAEIEKVNKENTNVNI